MKLIFVSKENEKAHRWDDDALSFIANGRIDGDGTGPSYGDPCYQPDTTLHLNGKPLNSDVDKYIVLPPALIRSVPEVVLGCQALILNMKNNLRTWAVVGDIGPSNQLGEISEAAARAINLNPNPNYGGTDDFILSYTLWPGRAAVVDGKKYELQPYRT